MLMLALQLVEERKPQWLPMGEARRDVMRPIQHKIESCHRRAWQLCRLVTPFTNLIETGMFMYVVFSYWIRSH